MSWLKKLADASPLLTMISIGKSPEGRDIFMIIASTEKIVTALGLKKSWKPLLLTQAGIHSGEIDGKDAGMILLRDIAFGIITFLILFLLLSRSIIVNEKWISFFWILGLLIVFEFVNLLIHPFLEEVTHHSPILMLLCLVTLASLLIPLHHKLEKWIKEKMTEKNKAIRLANAKKNYW